MSSNARVPGRAGEGIDDNGLRRERYAILMSFDNDMEVDANKLAAQWDVPQETVSGMISGVKRMSPTGTIAKALIREGFQPSQFPSWFGSNYRQSAQDASESEEEELEDDEIVETPLEDDETVPVTYAKPKKTPPKGQGDSGSKKERGHATERPQTLPTRYDEDLTISGEDEAILASRGISYDAGNNVWVKIQRQGKGQYVEQVNPIHELRRIMQETAASTLTGSIADKLLGNVEILTQRARPVNGFAL